MMMLLVLDLLGLLLVAGFLAVEVIGERRDETWGAGSARQGIRSLLQRAGRLLRR
jgi:hypothetical protein